jgi:hypothetical protein
MILLILAGSLIIGCGGAGVDDLASSGGGIGGSGVNGGGTGGTGISSGSVTAIGSVHVNGVRYDTSGAEIFVEGQSVGFGDTAVLANLKVGMVVRVEGDIETETDGTAQRVYFNDDLRGPVESIVEIDSVTTQLVVLGKTVVIDELTQVVNVTIAPSLVNDWIQVSGCEDAEGRIRATFVTEIVGVSTSNLKGTITAVDPSQSLITINGIDIGYQHATLIDVDPLTVGQLVEVTGEYSIGSVTIDADTIELVDVLGTDDIDSIELSGIIAEKTSATEFLLNRVPVVVSGQTTYSGGDADDIAEDVRVEAEGQLTNGTLVAERIIFMDFAKLEADVSSNNTGQSMILLHALADIPIRYNETTKVTGAAASTSSIDGSYHIKVIGRRLPSSETETVMAIHIITLDVLSDKVIIQGALEDDPPSGQTFITLLDHDIDISGVSDDGFESPGGTGYDAFLDSTEAGDIVSAKGTHSGGTVDWQSLSVE